MSLSSINMQAHNGNASNIAATMWNNPQFFQDLLSVQSMSAASTAARGGSSVPPQTQHNPPSWRPAKVYSPDRSVFVSILAVLCLWTVADCVADPGMSPERS